MTPLSPRQRELFALLLQGECEKRICKRMRIALPTLKSHRALMFAKVGVTSKSELMARFMQPTDEARRMMG